MQGAAWMAISRARDTSSVKGRLWRVTDLLGCLDGKEERFIVIWPDRGEIEEVTLKWLCLKPSYLILSYLIVSYLIGYPTLSDRSMHLNHQSVCLKHNVNDPIRPSSPEVWLWPTIIASSGPVFFHQPLHLSYRLLLNPNLSILMFISLIYCPIILGQLWRSELRRYELVAAVQNSDLTACLPLAGLMSLACAFNRCSFRRRSHLIDIEFNVLDLLSLLGGPPARWTVQWSPDLYTYKRYCRSGSRWPFCGRLVQFLCPRTSCLNRRWNIYCHSSDSCHSSQDYKYDPCFCDRIRPSARSLSHVISVEWNIHDLLPGGAGP